MIWTKPPFTVATLGTSLTTGRLSGYWDTLLEQWLAVGSQGPVRVFSCGKGSQTSIWGKDNAIYAAMHRATCCTIEFSINDAVPSFGITVTDHIANMSEIVEILREWNPDIIPVVMTMNPVATSIASGRPYLEDYYQADRDFAAANDCVLIDNFLVWDNPLSTGDAPDGLHPSDQAVRTKLLPNIYAGISAIREDYYGSFA